MSHAGTPPSDDDLIFWRNWSGEPESEAQRNEIIERFRRLTAGDDPDGEWDLCRLFLAKHLAHRAGLGLMTGWSEPPSAGQGWLDAAEALRLFETAAGSKTLDAGRRGQARQAHARLGTGMAVLRSANAMFTGNIPDVRAIWDEGRHLPDDDPFKPAVDLVTGLINSMRARVDDSIANQREALRTLTAGVRNSAPQAPWQRLARSVLGIVTGITATTDPAGVPVEEIKAIASEGETAEDPGVSAALSFLARYSQAVRDGESPADEQTLADLEQARKYLPADHPLAEMLPAFTYHVLAERHEHTGAIIDRDAASLYLREVQNLGEWQNLLTDGSQPGLIRALSALDKAGRALAGLDQVAADLAIADVRRELESLDPASSWRPVVAAGLGECLAFSSGSQENAIEGLRLVIDAADQAVPGVPFHGHDLTERGARARARLGQLTEDPRLLDEAVAAMAAETARADEPAWRRARQLLLLGQLRFDRYRLTGDRRDLDDGIAVMREADNLAGGGPGPLRPALLWSLANALRLRGEVADDATDRFLAIETGLSALEELAVEVLLQTGARRGLETAGLASSRGAAIAAWCISYRRPEQAVQALELGRGLVLHATTVAADVPALLHAAGRGDLIPRWSAAAGATPLPWEGQGARESATIPPDIRVTVFAALREASPDADLLVRPAMTELRDALGEAGADAFVYLIPPRSAIVVTATTIAILPLPGLEGNQVGNYNAALLRWNSSPGDLAAQADWHEALDDVCDWAWKAVAAPLVTLAGHWQLGRPPRLVIIPTGDLGGIPWHAARTRDRREAGDRPHYAIDDAVFSYAATARQFARAARHSPAVLSDQPVIVADPTGDLPEAAIEATEIRRRYYPSAELLGSLPGASGEGTAAQLLSRLPGGTAAQATLLHCGCHATVARSLADSHLVLAGGEKLTIAEIIGQAERRRPDQPGFLAVLGTCLSDLADVDRDEALTLASALLAAGASGVIGARWPAEDRPAAQLLLMFHHYLSLDQGSPADALRAAQLWMLDSDRAGLPDLPDELATRLRSRSYRAVHTWAAFTCQGK